jgi:hypothetical protein
MRQAASKGILKMEAIQSCETGLLSANYMALYYTGYNSLIYRNYE